MKVVIKRKNALELALFGMMLGFTVLTISMLLGMLSSSEETFDYLIKENLIRNIWCSALVGIGFNLPGVIYYNDKLSYPIKALIHLGIGYIVFFPIAFYANWIPVNNGWLAVVISIAILIIVSLGIWVGFYLYYKLEAERINAKIKERKL
ncbi:MAG: DUF3021 domain-containing protein [Acholeplasmataceae bacterium]|jgi:hypothetical protein|nr:DUF3021 domain-containing protein [Acholeplasmataceae bacterium]